MRELIIPVGDDECTRKIERVYGIKGELIRCKDCANYGYEEYGHYCIHDQVILTGEEYCAWAERKEE